MSHVNHYAKKTSRSRVLDGYDNKANIFGVKALGQLGICGAGAIFGQSGHGLGSLRNAIQRRSI